MRPGKRVSMGFGLAVGAEHWLATGNTKRQTPTKKNDRYGVAVNLADHNPPPPVR